MSVLLQALKAILQAGPFQWGWITLSGRLVCEDCGQKDWTDVNRVWRFEAVSKWVRRLDRVDIIRKPIWRDERL